MKQKDKLTPGGFRPSDTSLSTLMSVVACSALQRAVRAWREVLARRPRHSVSGGRLRSRSDSPDISHWRLSLANETLRGLCYYLSRDVYSGHFPPTGGGGGILVQIEKQGRI